MIRHILLFRFNEGVEQTTKDEVVDRLTRLGELCPTIGGWTIALNFANSPTAHDVVEIGDFASIKDLEAYKEHPAHKEFSEFVRPLATWALADIELES